MLFLSDSKKYQIFLHIVIHIIDNVLVLYPIVKC